MPINDKVLQLYNAMKADGADVGTEQEFNDYFMAKGDQGYKNRKAVYDAFKADGADIGENYEEFRDWLGLKPVTKPAVQAAAKPQPTGNAGGGILSSTMSAARKKLEEAQKVAAGYQATLEKQKQSAVPAAEAYKPTEQEMMSYGMTLGNAQYAANNATKGIEQQEKNLKKASPIGDGTAGAAYNKNLRRGGKSFNAETGHFEDAYMTSDGRSYTNVGEASNAQDFMDYQLDYDKFKKNMEAIGLGDITDEGSKSEEQKIKETEAALENIEVEIDKRRFSQAASLARGMGLAGSHANGTIEKDTDLDNYLAAQRMLERRLDALKAHRDDAGFWRGAGDQLTDPTSYSFGLTDLADSQQIEKIKSRIDAANGGNPNLSNSEKELARAYLLNQESQQLNKDNWWYGAGQGFGQTISFMKDFALTGGGFVGLAKSGLALGTKAGAKYAASRLGTFMTKNLGTTGKVLNKTVLYGAKGLGLATGAEVGGFLTSNTIQIANTFANINNRNIGTMAIDDEGKLTFKDSEGLAKSVLFEELKASGEAGSELVGMGFDVLPGILGRVIRNTTAGNLLKRFTTNKFWQAGEKSINFLGVQSLWGEGMEEEYNMARTEILNRITGGTYDPNAEGFFDLNAHLNTWATVGITSVALRVPQMVASGTSTANYYGYKYNLNQSDKRMQSVFGDNERYQTVKAMLDGADNKNIGNAMNSLLSNAQLSKEEKEAVVFYAQDLINLRGYNIGNVVAEANGVKAQPRVAGYQIKGNSFDEVDEEGNVIAHHEYDNRDDLKAGLYEAQQTRFDNDLKSDISVMKARPNGQYEALVTEWANQHGRDPEVFGWVLQDALDKPFMERSEADQWFVEEFAKMLHEAVYDNTMLHEQQSAQDGEGVADGIAGDIENPNSSEAAEVAAAWTAALEARQNLFANNETIAQEVISRENEGMSHQEIISSLDSFDQQDVQTIIDYYNKRAKYEGFVNRMKQKIDEEAVNSRERHAFKGTVNGNADLSNVYTITDGTNRYYLVSGNVTTDGNGRITGSDSGLVIGMDLDGSFVNIGDTNGYTVEPTTQTLDQFEAEERDRLQRMWTGVLMPNGPVVAPEQPVVEEKPVGEPTETVAETVETSGTALDRIPKDEEGNLLYEQATPEDTYDALVEQVGDAALMLAKKQLDAAEKERDKLMKQLEKGDVKGNTLQEQINETKALWQAAKDADERAKFWMSVIAVPNNRRLNETNKPAGEPAGTVAAGEGENKPAGEAPEYRYDTPQAARERGYKVVEGQRIDRQEEKPMPTGMEVEVQYSTKDKVKGRMTVSELGEVQGSHLTNGQVNDKHFIPEAQPKAEFGADRQLAAQRNASEENFRPELMLTFNGTQSAYSGSAPQTNRRGEVIQGNGRRNLAEYIYAPGNEKVAEKYKTFLKAHAEELGTTAEEIDKMEKPFAHIVLDVTDEEAIRLGQFTAADLETGGKKIPEVTPTVTKLGDNYGSFSNILLRHDDPDASLAERIEANMEDAVNWLNRGGFISNTEAKSLLEDKEAARQFFRDMLTDVLFRGAHPDLRTMFYELPKNIQSALVSVVGREVGLKQDESILKDIQESIQAYHELMASSPQFAGVKGKNFEERYAAARAAVEDWLRQINLDGSLNKGKYSNFALELAKLYVSLKDQKTLAGKLREYYDIMSNVPREGGLFETTAETGTMTREQAIKQIFGIEYGGQGTVSVAGNNQEGQAGNQGGANNPQSGERGAEEGGPSNGGTGDTGNVAEGGVGERPEGEPAGTEATEREKFIQEHPLTEDEIKTYGKGTTKLYALRYLSGEDESEAAKGAYLNIYNKVRAAAEQQPATTQTIEEIEVPTISGGTRKVKAEKVQYSDIKKGDVVWYSGSESTAPISSVVVQGVDNGDVYGMSYNKPIVLPKDRTYYREIPSAEQKPAEEAPKPKQAETKPAAEKPKTETPEQPAGGQSAATQAAQAKLNAILARMKQHKKPTDNNTDAYKVEGLTPEQLNDMYDLVDAGAELGYTLLDGVESKDDWVNQMRDMIGEQLKDATGYNDQDVTDLLNDLWNAPYENESGDVKTVADYAADKGINVNNSENETEEGNGGSDNPSTELPGSTTVGGSTEAGVGESGNNEGNAGTGGETGFGPLFSGGNTATGGNQETTNGANNGETGETPTGVGRSTGGNNEGGEVPASGEKPPVGNQNERTGEEEGGSSQGTQTNSGGVHSQGKPGGTTSTSNSPTGGTRKSRESGNNSGTNGGNGTNVNRGTQSSGESPSVPARGNGVGRNTNLTQEQTPKKPLADISQEKAPYKPASVGGKFAIGSVVPSGIADAIANAFKRLKEKFFKKKSVLDFVREELGYKTNEEMLSDFESGKTNGLAAEQVDAVALAIGKMKDGKSFIVGDMTGVGKGRTAAALIRWGLQHKKKVVFITEKSSLFSDMYRDLTDIGCDYMPFTTNDDKDAHITDADGNKVVPHPSTKMQSALWKSGSVKLPTNKKGRQYDFVMTTYSQASNPRTANGKAKLEWLKEYSKDAIVIMDESHNASGSSNRGNFFREVVEGAGGVTFLSATYAKRPDNMLLYAIRSSMKAVNMPVSSFLEAIKQYGVAMQELMSSALFGSGEMIRRERDMSGVKTTWADPKEIYTEEEFELSRKTSDKMMDLINDIIDFQRDRINPIVKEHEAEHNQQNQLAALMGGNMVHTTNTAYKSQVSNVVNLMTYAMKAKKAAEMAIEQIKQGKRPVIAVENTLDSYIKELPDEMDSADFGPVFEKGIKFSLKYMTAEYAPSKEEGGYKKVEGTEQYFDAEDELDENGLRDLENLRQRVKDFIGDADKVDLSLSPIDLVKQMIADAGYSCGEITGRSTQLVRKEGGGYRKEPIRQDKKKTARKFNGGSAKNPLPKEEQYDALVLNVAGATGISLHSSKTFGNQQPRTMIILQPARDVNTEVQMRGRIDRTGQVHRGEYFYVTSPIPAEQKLTMMLKQKLASLDAQSSGTQKVSSNKVESQDMDNKYGDEVCKEFLLEHLLDINAFLEGGLRRNNKTREWEGRPGLLYDVLKDIQRMPCEMQEKVITELSQRYADHIDYLNQNGINDLETTTMDLEAVTIDKATFVKGKDNESENEFAHDTTIERVEVNVLKKPMRSADIKKKMKDLDTLDEDGVPKEGVLGGVTTKVKEVVDQKLKDREERFKEQEDKHEEKVRQEHPKKDDQTDEEYETMIKSWPSLVEMQNKHKADLNQYAADLQNQYNSIYKACMYLKPGRPYLVPLTDDVSDNGALMYGRFLGFQLKNGDPRQVQAVFAVKDSRSMITVPIVNQNKVIEKIINERYDMEILALERDEYGDDLHMDEKAKKWDEWWDKMIPKNTNRQIRYMITGNVLQACGSLGKYKGQIVTFTRKNKETGEITLERGMLLAENFDPENFKVRRAVEKKDVWNSYDEVKDERSAISCHREGNRMVVKFEKRKGEKLVDHPVNKDDVMKKLAMNEEIRPSGKTALLCVVNEENVEKALEHLYKEYGYTKEELFVMPDSTDKPDAIVRSNRPYQDIIEEFKDKYGYNQYAVDSKIRQMLKRYKMDVNNDDLKQQIREAVMLRQAYLRREYATQASNRLAWEVLVRDQYIEQAGDNKESRERNMRIKEAILEELDYRGFKGTAYHYTQGQITADDVRKMFDQMNDPRTAEGRAKKELFDKVMAKVSKLPMEIFMNEKLDNETGGSAAGRVINYNWKYMNADYISDQAKADTILHELIHTVTAYADRCVDEGLDHLLDTDMVDAINELHAIFNVIENDPTFTHDGVKAYGLTNVREMLSEAGSNSEFREDLKKTNLWQKLWSGILKFFGIKQTVSGAKQVNAFEAIMLRLDYLIENFKQEAWEEYYKNTRYGGYGYQKKDAQKIDTDNPMEAIEQADRSWRENIRIERQSNEGTGRTVKEVRPIIEKLLEKYKSIEGVCLSLRETKDRDLLDLLLPGAIKETDTEEDIKAGANVIRKYFKNSPAIYDYKQKKIFIFADEMPEGLEEETLFHENIHAILHRWYGDKMRGIADRFWEESPDKIGKRSKRFIEKNYTDEDKFVEERKRHDEWFTYNLADAMVDGDIDRVLQYLTTDKGAEARINNILNEIGYDRRKEESERKGRETFGRKSQGESERELSRSLRGIEDPIESIRRAAEDWAKSVSQIKSDMSDLDKNSAKAVYHHRVNSVAFVTTESMQDSKLGLKAGQSAIAKDKEIPDSQNAYQAANLSFGITYNEQEQFKLNMQKPLEQLIEKILKGTDWRMSDLERYVFTKHGLERNRALYVRDWLALQRKINEDKADELIRLDETEQDFIDANNEAYEKLMNGDITFPQYLAELDSFIRGRIDKKYKAEEHDYSGFTEMFGDEDGDFDEAEILDELLKQEEKIDGVPSADAEGTVAKLWGQINAISALGLEKYRTSGMMSNDAHKRISNMFHWYVPLRGFAEGKAAEDHWQYMTAKTGAGKIGGLLKKAKGRKSEAGFPFSTLFAMTNKAIADCNQNIVRQHLWRLCQAHKNDLVVTSETWVVLNPATNEWVTDYPQIDSDMSYEQVVAAVEDFNKRMKDLEVKGEAKRLRGNAKIDYRVDKTRRGEHIIEVNLNGDRKQMIVVGNPRMAQAVNGLLEYEGGSSFWSRKVVAPLKHAMQSLSTSYSLKFVHRNLARDWTHFSAILLTREGSGYTKAAEGYYFETMPRPFRKDSNGMVGLFRKWRANELDMNIEVERDFKDFMDNGGITGFVHTQKVEAYQKELEKLVTDKKGLGNYLDRLGDAAAEKLHLQGAIKINDAFWDATFGLVQAFNEAVENNARFATFRASRHYAQRTKARSAYDAKEVTVNFNKKGAGKKTAGFKSDNEAVEKAAVLTGELSQLLNANKMFFNATMQAVCTIFKNTMNADGTVNKEYVTRLAARYALPPFLLSMAVPFINNAIMSIAAELGYTGGDDGDDPYANLADYTRRNNICLWFGWMPGMNNNSFITIPIGQELAAFYSLGDMTAGLTYEPNLRPVDKSIEEEMADFFQVFIPIDYTSRMKDEYKDTWTKSGAQLLSNFSGLAPISDAFLNISWQGRGIYKEDTYDTDKLIPEYRRGFKNANKQFVSATEWLNDVTGGDERKRGLIQINPSAAQYLMEQYTSGPGRLLANTLISGPKDGWNFILGNETDFNIRKIEGLNAFFTQGNDQTQFYRIKAKFNLYERESKKFMYENNITELEKQAKADDPAAKLDLQKLEKTKEGARAFLIREENRQDKRHDKIGLDDLKREINKMDDGVDKRKKEAEYNMRVRSLVERLDSISNME